MTNRDRLMAAAAVVELMAAHPEAPHGARWRAAVERAVPAVERLVAAAGVRVTSRERAGYLVHALREVAPGLDRAALAAALRTAGGDGWRSPRPTAGPWGAWLTAQGERADAVGDLARMAVAELGGPVPDGLGAVVVLDGTDALGDAFALAVAEWSARVTRVAAHGWRATDGLLVACPACPLWHIHGAAEASLEFRVSHCPVDGGAYSVVLVHPAPFRAAWRSTSQHVSTTGRRALGDLNHKESNQR